MFGHMKAQPILTVGASSIDLAVGALVAATENAQPTRWIEFPASILLFLAVSDDPQSGAFYVLDRRSRTWFWIDFDDAQYGGYGVGDFDLLVHKYDFLSLVERPALLCAETGWLLESGKSAEMARPCN